MPIIKIDGRRVHYSDGGSGIPIIFLPGIAGHYEIFEYQQLGLSEKFRVLSPDIRPVGAISKYTLSLLAKDVSAFMKALKIHAAVIAGYTFGGLIAAEFACNFPGKCQGIILMSTTAAPIQMPEDKILSKYLDEQIIEISLIKRIINSFVTRKDVSYREPLDKKTVETRVKLLKETDLSKILPAINVPCLVTAGALEQPFVLSSVQKINELVDDSVIEIIEASQHLYFKNRHDIFNEIVAEFVLDNTKGI